MTKIASMANLKIFIPAILGATLLFTACGNNENKETTATDSTAAARPLPLELADVTGSPEFADAQISIGKVTAAEQGTDSVKVSFAFNVKNYELKGQTADAAGKMCNNSDKGQHIHFILDNKPYAALYEPTHEVVLPKNGEHYLLVFLSRSYHESLKNKGAAAIYHFKIDEKGKLQKMDEPKTPMVFYSRPKGDYTGKANTDNLLFDFYVWNAPMADTGYMVHAAIKGEGVDTTITVKQWKAQFLKNMPLGKPSITLTLIDKAGNKVEGPNTEVTREFNLLAEEGAK